MLHSSTLQLAVGFGVGIASVFVPALFKPLIISAFMLAVAQGLLLYHTGGTDALLIAGTWIVGVVQTVLLGLAGLGIGRWAAEIVASR
jgi:hypothetical protein